MKFTELRQRYTKMIYHSFHIDEDDQLFRITFHFEICGLTSFYPTTTIPKIDHHQYHQYQEVVNTAFSIGMVELISYWKTCCPYDVEIACNHLTQSQIEFWKKLYFHGLGEFFYTNHIEVNMNDFMNLHSTGATPCLVAYPFSVSGNLIPVGGGKDSFVSLAILKPFFKENHTFIINPIKSALASSKAAGYVDEKMILAKRCLDSQIMDLNKQGFLNGHTPFSAMAAFTSLLAALLNHKKYICLSNESSANESTIKDSKVNHQYSKSFEFEMDFSNYVANYITKDIHYFSLLRPLSELQIAYIFSKHPSFHPVFRSCNVGQKEGVWCGHCAKCLFVCILLSAFLSLEQLNTIFGRDMLNDPSLLNLFEQLTGIQDNKPFECVGTREEVNQAICLFLQRNKEVPILYQNYKNTSYYEYYKDVNVDLQRLEYEHHVPKLFIEYIQQELYGSKEGVNND